MNRRRLAALGAFLVGLALVVYGSCFRTHLVMSPSGEVFEVAEPLLIQATCTSSVKPGSDGLMEGDPSTWNDTEGKDCPT